MTDTAVQHQSGTQSRVPDDTITFDAWLEALKSAIAANDLHGASGLFQADAVVRDLLALSWDFRNGVNREEAAELLTKGTTTPPTRLSIKDSRVPTRGEESGHATLETFIEFENEKGTGVGFAKLVEETDGVWRAAALALALDELKSHPKNHGPARPMGRVKGPVADRVSWAEDCDREFEKEDPTVVILGAGHNGLMLAVRLQVMGIPTLIIEKNERVGDTWRKRYNSLALHTPLTSDSLPYLPFPETWTQFTPKDKLADFLEAYSTIMDLRVWTGSEAKNVEYDDQVKEWNLDVIRKDGTVRSLKPKHLVFATGLLAEPLRPQFSGQDKFHGEVMHTADYRGFDEWVGKRAVVVGSGVSGHDIAQDLAEHGVNVTMIQRSETVVLNTSTFHSVMHTNHTSGAYAIDEADLVNAATPFGELPRYGAAQLAKANELDRGLLKGLSDAGFKLGSGPDGTGVLGLIYAKNTTGYYYNAGASELIADGTIKLAHGNVVGFTESEICLEDGSTLEADLVVFATGYRGPEWVVEKVLGEEVAERLSNFAEVGPDREYGRLWRQSGIDKLWFMIALAIGDGRFYSNLLALQIADSEAETASID
ncbi:MAG: flavin-containing monooxygenase [Gulosibacter sp.]|uniref:flavin-containing monooxygenase n=1 Tax=Gulosibacter sp. TaxID=2817531 RepID=UPI003F934114